MQTIVMEVNVLLSGIVVILSYVAIIDATILLTNIYISKPFNRSSFPQGFIFGTASSDYKVQQMFGGREPNIWDTSTHNYPEKIKDRSNGSEKDKQSFFLDILCCFKGYELTKVQNILCAHHSYNVKYQNKVLIDDSLTIQDLIEKMAKELVRRESPVKPEKCSRLWLPEDIIYVLIENTGSSSLRVLEWKTYSSQEFPSNFDTKQLYICKLLNMDFMSPMQDELVKKSTWQEQSLCLKSYKGLWRLVGLVSSVVGLLCYALSPSFNRLIGRWNILKFSLYGVFSLAIFTTILFVKQFSPSTRYAHIKTYTSFVVLMIISVYSFYYDKALNGKPEILSIVSNAAFALMSLSLSKLIRFGFEIGIFAYLLGCLLVQLWTINWMLILVAVLFGCPLFVMHSSSDSQEDFDNRDQIIDESSGSDPEVGNAGQQDVGNESQVIFDSYPDSQQEVSSESQVIHCSVTIPKVASSGSDQHVDIILETNSISVVAL